MNYRELQKQVNRLRAWDISFHIALGIGISFAGLYFIYLLNYTEWYEQTNFRNGGKNISVFGIYLLSIGMILFGVREVIKTIKDFKLKEVRSKLSIHQNKQLVANVFEHFKIARLPNPIHKSSKVTGIEFWKYRYNGNFGIKHNYYVFVYDHGIYLCAFNSDFRGYYSGVGSQKKLKLIIEKLKVEMN